jgi:hypothetical protein
MKLTDVDEDSTPATASNLNTATAAGSVSCIWRQSRCLISWTVHTGWNCWPASSKYTYHSKNENWYHTYYVPISFWSQSLFPWCWVFIVVSHRQSSTNRFTNFYIINRINLYTVQFPRLWAAFYSETSYFQPRYLPEFQFFLNSVHLLINYWAGTNSTHEEKCTSDLEKLILCDSLNRYVSIKQASVESRQLVWVHQPLLIQNIFYSKMLNCLHN